VAGGGADARASALPARIAIGQRSFDPLDTEEIEHCLLWLDGQPEVAGIPADTIRAALASVGPGERFSLLVEEPKAS
jgi:hypothetical protein